MKILYKITFLMTICFFIAIAASADVKSVTVDGFCYLDGATDHSGTKVLFSAVSPSAETDSVYTNADGSYSIGLAEGIYTVHFSHEGWQQYSIPGELVFFENTTLDDVVLMSGTIMEVSGRQNGIWTADFTYHVVGDAGVYFYDDTLVIEPGTKIKFMGDFEFTITDGTLLAMGTESDTILFTSGQTPMTTGDWSGIRNFSNSSVFSYVRIEYAYLGLSCSSASPTISNSTFQYNGSGFFCGSMASPLFSNNTTCNNVYHGISLDLGACPTICNNVISDNGNHGIKCYNHSFAIINYNLIRNNNGDGIFCADDSEQTIHSNTIYGNNECGIYCSSSSSADVFNNILCENNTGIVAESSSCSFLYNLFWENNTTASGGELPAAFGDIITVNLNGDPCDTYLNLFMDPLFVDPGNQDFHLNDDSPCIDAGNPDTAYYDPDGTIADIGAFYFDQYGIGISEAEMHSIVVYPNPTNGLINFSADEIKGDMQIKVFDTRGNVYYSAEYDGARNLLPEQLDLSRLPGGIYFICSTGKDYYFAKKIVIQ